MSNGNSGKAAGGATFPSKNGGNGNGNGGNGSRRSGSGQPEVPELALPKKINKGNAVANMRQLPCYLNGYDIDLTQAAEYVFQHELKFYAVDDRDKEKELSRGPRNDVANNIKHNALYEMFRLMLKDNPNDFGVMRSDDMLSYVYDRGINFYSLKKLMNVGEEKRFDLNVEKLSATTRDYLSKRHVKIYATLLATTEINLRSTSAISVSLDERDRSVNQFLEVLSSQYIYSHSDYYTFKDKMFEKDSKNDIQIHNDPRIIKSGMQKNIRFIGDSQEKSHPFLQVDPKKSAFYKEMDLLQFLFQMFNIRDERDAELRLSDRRNKVQIARELKGLTVKTTHLQKNTYFAIHNLTEHGCDELFFEDRSSGVQKSVRQYYEEKYHMRLRFPNLPCVVEKRVIKTDGQNRAKESYYPMEVLRIYDGQRIPRQKMTPSLTEQMIRNCQMLPSRYVQEMENQRQNAFLTNGAPQFRAFGIKISSDVRKVGGDVLFPPAIQYGGERVELPARDKFGNDDVAWKLDRQRFLVPAQIKVWVAALFQKGIPPAMCNGFVNELARAAQGLGMNLPKPAAYEELDYTDQERLLERMKFYKSKNVQLVVFFTRDKLDPVHDTMKLLETQSGIVTQHISYKTVEKAASGRGANLVYGNILQKMNMKMGGINHDISTTQVFCKANRANQNVFKEVWLKEPRMFFGIDMSHASPQNLYERQAGILPSEPTIVGMSYTVGRSIVNLRGTYWCQKPRLTIIEELADKVVTAIENYNAHNNGNFPSHLIVYRSGASEGEYAKVITYEKKFFDEAFETLRQKHPSFRRPTLTIMIVQRTSNYRVVPQHMEDRAPAAKQNVPSGTVIDREVMHPTQTEFLMVAQKSIQYALCFGHAIVTSPVSVPGPLYSAGDLAKRGRNNWKVYNFGGDAGDDRSVRSGDSGGRARNTGEADFFITLSNALRPVIDSKWWA